MGLIAALVCLLGLLINAQNPPQSIVTADDFNQFTWRYLGPTTFSERITGFAVPRGQSQTYYVLTASGGLWKTEDGGIRFDPIFEKYGTGSMGWMAIAPSKPDVLYLGTGEPMHARSSTHGNGMWKSTDAGKTWTHIGLEKSYFIPKVEVDARNPDIVFAAAEGKLYDNEMDCERGLFRSADGGKTWTNIFPSVASDRGVGDFVIDPRNSNVIIAAAYKHYRRAWTYDDRDAGNGIYKTTNGGKTWTRLTTGLPAAGTPLGRIGLAIFERDPNIVYARVDRGISLGHPQTDGVANFRAAAGGRAAQAGSAQVNQTEGGYYGRIIIDPNNDKVVYCGDTNTTVSRDSGKTFETTGWDGDGKTHVDHRVVWIDPLNSRHILSGNDGGVSESWDDGKHWSQKNGISAQQFYDIAVDNLQPYNVMGGTQDNGAWLGPTQNRNSYGLFSSDWLYLPTGDGFYVVRDWWNPEYVYYESQFGASSRQILTTGQTQSLAVRLTPEQAAAGEPALRYQWNAPIVLSPHNPGIVFIASQYVYRSFSRGDTGTFVRISPDLTKADKGKIAESRKTNLQWATVYTFSESPKKPGLYWAGTDDGNVQMSPDGGTTWVNITGQFYDTAGRPKPGVKGDLIPYDRWVKRVVASAFDENTAYAAFSGYRTHNEDKTWLFVTKDLGKTWTDISGGMNNPIFDVEEDPENASVLYLGTDYGLFVTIDQGKTWAPFSTSAPSVTIRDVAIQKRDREMAIGTYGRGIYVADIGPIKEFTPAVFEEPAHLFDIKPTIRWSRYERRGETLGEMAKVNNPPVGATIYYYLKADAQSAKLTIKDLEGATLQDVTTSAKKGLQKYFWNLSRQAAGGGRAGGPGGRAGAGGAGEPGGAPAATVPNPDQPPQLAAPPAGGPGGRGGRGAQVEAGVYKVTLTVDGKEVATKRMTVSPDPLFK